MYWCVLLCLVAGPWELASAKAPSLPFTELFHHEISTAGLDLVVRGDIVAVSGDTLIVGATVSASPRRAAVVFQRRTGSNSSSDWSLKQLISFDEVGSEWNDLGSGNIAFCGDLVVFAAKYSSGVEVFERDKFFGPREFQKTAFISSDDIVPIPQTGRVLAVAYACGDTVAASIGVGDDIGGRSLGLFLFQRRWSRRRKPFWKLVQRFWSPANCPKYASSVTMSEDTIVASTDSGPCQGLRIFERDTDSGETASTWFPRGRLTSNDPAIVVGAGVALFNDTIAASAELASFWRPSQGFVYIYNRISRVWRLRQVLTACDGSKGDSLGHGLAVHDDVLIAGAPALEFTDTRSGSAYVFHRNSSTGVWHLVQKLRDTHNGDAGPEWPHLGISATLSIEFQAIVGSLSRVYSVDVSPSSLPKKVLCETSLRLPTTPSPTPRPSPTPSTRPQPLPPPSSPPYLQPSSIPELVLVAGCVAVFGIVLLWRLRAARLRTRPSDRIYLQIDND